MFYVSGHGFGHAVRTGLVLSELHRLAPALHVIVRTSAPSWLFPVGTECVALAADVGVVQADSLTPLFAPTLERAAAFEAERQQLADAEAALLAPLNPVAIAADIPPMAFDVAARLGVPGLAIGNFSWDWIYENLPCDHAEIHDIVATIRASEAHATVLLRLPFHSDMSAFPRIEDVPLIAQVSRTDPSEIRRRFGISVDRPAVLLSFGGFALERLNEGRLGDLSDFVFVTTSPRHGQSPDNLVFCPPNGPDYHDLLAACDVVVMKPGYATVADCLANRVPMVYASREGFAEEQILVDAMHRLGRAVAISQRDLLDGNLGPALRAAISSRQPWQTVRMDGASVVAGRILEMVAET